MEDKDELREYYQKTLKPWLMRYYFRVNLTMSLLLLIIYFVPICLLGYSSSPSLSDFMEGWPLFVFWLTVSCLFILNFMNKSLLGDRIVAICNIVIYFVNIIAIFVALYDECHGNITCANGFFYFIYLSLIFIGVKLAKLKLNEIKME